MKFIIILVLLGLFYGCNSHKSRKLVYDKIVFTKGTFQQPFLDQENIPDTIFDKNNQPQTIFASRSIIKIEGSNALMYFNERMNTNNGYYKASLNDSIVENADKLMRDIDFNNIIDSSLVPRLSNIYDGYVYYMFLTKNGKTKEISFIDAKYYRPNFITFVNFIDSLGKKVNMTKMVDSMNTKNEFDSLKKSIVDNIRISVPPLKSSIQFLPGKNKMTELPLHKSKKKL
jgi:hypothetical protein